MIWQGPPLASTPLLAEVLAAGLARDPDGVAIASRDVRMSYRALDMASDRLAAGYRELGLGPGDRLASLMPNRVALLIHYLACFKGRHVAVPLNYRYTSREIDHALHVSGATALLHHVEREDDVRGADEAGRLLCGSILYGCAEGVDGVHLERLIERDVAFAPPPYRDDDPVLILFTSGSTGAAKGVTHSFRSMATLVATTAAGYELAPGEVVLGGSSLSHIGAILHSLAALSVGGRAVVAHNFGAAEILALLRRERPVVMAMLPAALFGLVRDPDARRDDFASVRVLHSGGDKVPEELRQESRALTGLMINEGYGATEYGIVTFSPPSGEVRPGSIGKALPGVALAVRDQDGEDLGPGVAGVLWGRTDGLMRGYWNDPEATADVLADGWFNSGDLVEADDDGYLWFRGRKKQIIVHDGSNIFPQEVEDALLAHPNVAAAGVIGVHDLLHGENVRAYVVAKPGSVPSADLLIAFARERVGYKAPEEIVFLNALPLNPTGKLDRVELKRMAAA